MKELVYICYSIQELEELVNLFASDWHRPEKYKPGSPGYSVRASYIKQFGSVGIIAVSGGYSTQDYYINHPDRYDVRDFRDNYSMSYGTVQDIGSTSIKVLPHNLCCEIDLAIS